jgi:hypothetical protein
MVHGVRIPMTKETMVVVTGLLTTGKGGLAEKHIFPKHRRVFSWMMRNFRPRT